ncbi:MAG TPA: PfkB family carbohydrate kinase [Pyrinomonadaceae bacterium]|nr:PfkB family carbohydrate kinase [Pyrinomonadaceae bacterium]
MSERLSELVRAFEGRRVVVVGDAVADQFVSCEISRVSREAPVMIMRHERTETVPGGAANCAMNLASLGARVSLVCALGDDAPGRELLSALEAAGVGTDAVYVSPRLSTTTKVRFLGGLAHSPRQQVVRVDYENAPLGRDEARRVGSEVAERLRAAREGAEAVVVSDYNYGVAEGQVLELIRGAPGEGGGPILVDSRFRLDAFRGFTSATPNEDEVEHWAGRALKQTAALTEEAERLRAKLDLRALLVTRGGKGALLVEEGREPLNIEAVGSHDAVDVTGAGDTVMAAYSLALASGASFGDAARLANHAGGVVVLKRGTATVTAEELLASLAREARS